MLLLMPLHNSTTVGYSALKKMTKCRFEFVKPGFDWVKFFSTSQFLAKTTRMARNVCVFVQKWFPILFIRKSLEWQHPEFPGLNKRKGLYLFGTGPFPTGFLDLYSKFKSGWSPESPFQTNRLRLCVRKKILRKWPVIGLCKVVFPPGSNENSGDQKWVRTDVAH